MSRVNLRFGGTVRTTDTTAGHALAGIKPANANTPMLVKRIELTLVTAVISEIGLLVTDGAGTRSGADTDMICFNTQQNGSGVDPQLFIYNGGAQPTPAIATYLRKATLPATIGANVVWEFEDDPESQEAFLLQFAAFGTPYLSLSLMNFGASACGLFDMTVDLVVPA